MLPLWRIVLERGEEYHVYAETEKDAYELAKEVYPEIMGADLKEILAV
jgi:hypothetical protein